MRVTGRHEAPPLDFDPQMRVTLAALSIALSLFLIFASARFGFARLLARYATATNSIPVADAAVKLSPSDPETHRARAAVFNRFNLSAEAAKSLGSATSLRYRDDYLWIDLANTREDLGDTAGALAALDQAVRWAPHYAHTHWQRGNILLRMGRSADAFTELKTAAKANRNYVPSVVDLAWGINRGDVGAIQIDDETERLALIRLLAAKGKGKDTLDQIKLLPTPLSTDQTNQIVHLLVSSKSFREAFALARGSSPSRSLLINAGFEDPVVLNDAGFGWIVAPEFKNRLAVDVSEKVEGAKSLQITFDGSWAQGAPLLSQTIVVEPETTYRLSFEVKTKDLVTGGAPLLTVSDAASNQLLGKSETFPSSSNTWLPFKFEFTTLPGSQAVTLRLQRNNCTSSPCPIFGTLWLDQFQIVQTKTAIKQ